MALSETADGASRSGSNAGASIKSPQVTGTETSGGPLDFPPTENGADIQTAGHACGTWNAYKHHLKRGEKPCSACQEAMRQQSRDRYAASPRPRTSRPTEWACTVCDSTFTAPTAHRQRRYCSAGCAKRREKMGLERARAYTAMAGRAADAPSRRPGRVSGPRAGSRWRKLRVQVLAEERNCWLCDGAIDFSAAPRSRWSPSVDHVIPLVDGGALLDRSNVRAAHYWCNSVRGRRETAAAA